MTDVHKQVDGGVLVRWTACGRIITKHIQADRSWYTVTCERCLTHAPNYERRRA